MNHAGGRPTRSGRRRIAAAALAAPLALALAACGGSSDSSTPEATAGPISAIFEDVFASFDDAEVMAAQQKKTEEVVAACMREKGWEYTPATQSSGVSYSEEDMRGGLSEKEYAEQHGYGIVSSPESADPTAGEEFVDPNADYLASLGEKDVEAYYIDLYGDQSQYEDLGEDDEIPEYDPTTAGCQGKAMEDDSSAAYMKVYEDPQYKDLLDKMQAVYTNALTDPAVVEAKTAWVSCMAEAGLPELTDPDNAQQALWERQSELYGDGESEPDQAALDAFKADEIKTAVADLACKESSKYATVQIKAQVDSETAFYNENKDLVDRFAEAIRAATATATADK